MKRLITAILPAALLCAALVCPVLAGQSFGSFSAKAVLPDNQINSNNTYFDLRLEPGQQQTVELRISNTSGEPMTAAVSLNPASTGRDGLIVYDQPGVRDESMRHAIGDVATLQQSTVPVPANGEASVFVDLAMPEESFDGVLLGGLVVTKQQEENAPSTEADGLSLQNQLVYVVGLQLRQTTEAVEPELHLKSIQPGTVNYHTAVTVTLQNSEAVVMKGMQVEAAVYSDGEDSQPLRTLNLIGAEMAPNSIGEFIIDWENQALEPGAYRLRMSVRQEDRLWEWDEGFEILSAAATTANQEAVNVQIDRGAGRWLTSLLLLALLAVIVLTALRILRDRRRRDLRGGAH